MLRRAGLARFPGAVMEVADHGAGFGPELLPKIFDLIVQGERTFDRTRGLGIGLAVVNRLVEMRGWEAAPESPGIGRGSYGDFPARWN